MPLRFPRPVMALIATGAAAVSLGLSALPASADQVRHSEWWLSSLGVTGAWAASQGDGVTIAVLSDGVDTQQADLSGAVTSAPAPSGAPVASGQYLAEQGTAIASLIAGRGHGSAGSDGIIGVAPKARILSVPVTLPADDPDLTEPAVAAAIPAAIAAGIRYAVSHGATVIDLPADPGQPDAAGTGGAAAAAGGSAAEQSAVAYALSRNVVLVAPAGDNAATTDAPNYPAAYPGVIAVGAFNSAFVKAPWSSRQSYVTLTAAGAGVVAASNAGGYQTMNSTSAASAVVSGIAALLRSRYPGLTAAQVRQALTTSTVFRPAHGLSDGSGYGTVNADKAMAAAALLATPPADRAGAGAQPLVAPAGVAGSPASQGIGAQLVRAGEIAGGVLVLLLLIIAVYAATGRRRRPGTELAVPAEWTRRQAQSRYPQAAGPEADRMLEVFNAPVSSPGRPGLADRPARAALPSGYDDSDHGLFAPGPDRPDGRLSLIGPVLLPGQAEPGRPPTHGPASRAVARRPLVSGAPPWEPASAPQGELPWTAAPGRLADPARSGAAEQPGWQGESSGRSAPAGPASAADQPGTRANLPGPARQPDQPSRTPLPSRTDPAERTGPRAPETGAAAGYGLQAEPGPPDWAAVPAHYVPPAQPGPADWAAVPAHYVPPAQPGPRAPGTGAPAGYDPAAGNGAPAEPGAADWAAALDQARSAHWASAEDVSRLAQRGSWQQDARPSQGYAETARSQSPAGSGPDEPWQPRRPERPWQPDRQQSFPAPEAAQQRIAPSGLPVRQPRASQAAAPRSPSGSLWEPVDGSEPSPWQQVKPNPAAGPDDGRPIFVWNPVRRDDDSEQRAGE